MESKCQFSSLTIPNEPGYAIAAAGYLVEIAGMIGFEDQDLQAIAAAVRQAITAQIEYSFEPGEKAFIQISCERILEGFKISMKDKGLPFDHRAGAFPNGTNQTSLKSSFASRIFSFSEQFEKLGFFFAGLLPGGLLKGDALILQYLNNVAINYDAIQLDSEIARHILDHIKRSDPNAV